MSRTHSILALIFSYKLAQTAADPCNLHDNRLCIQPTVAPGKMAMAQNKWPLPIEITKRIIELACWPDGPRGGYNSRQLVTYAGVSREWRDLVERHTFRNLRLDRARLADVNRIVCRRRRAHVRTVSLDVELEPYGRDVYGAFETAEEIARHSAIFTETLRLLFDVFSRWAPAGNGLDGDGAGAIEAGIWLRIKTFSPSDVDRCGEAEMIRRRGDFHNHDIRGDRYIHSILQLLPAATELPVVGCVSKLSSGGEWYSRKARHISAAAYALIINSLPNAKKIDIKVWDNEKKDLELRKRLRDGKSLNQSSRNRGMHRSLSPNRHRQRPCPNALSQRRGDALMSLRNTERPLQHPTHTH